VGGSLAATLAAGRSLSAQQKAEQRHLQQRSFAPPQYRIIYNWDGAPHGYSEFPQSQDQFLEKTFAPLKDTQVGALFWCIGEHEAAWDSKTIPIVGDSQSRVYSSARAMRHNERIPGRRWSGGVMSWESTSTCQFG
jgi:hypothetical protein